MSQNKDVKGSLVAYLKELHLPTMRASYEEQARRAEQETLSYEQYLLELSRQECETQINQSMQNNWEQQRAGRDVQSAK